MKPKLYQYAACPFCSKVASLLHYKGVDYETIEVHPLNKKEIAFSQDYRAVPIYIDGSGKQVNDSTPILRHIDAEFPQKSVFGRDAAEKTEEDRWLAWSEAYVQGLPTVIYATLSSSLKSFNYITKVGRFSWADRLMIKYSGAVIMTLVAKKIRRRQGIADPQVFLRDKVNEWCSGLGRKSFIGGKGPNAADIAVYGISRVVAGLSAGTIFSENAAFSAWMDRMEKETGYAPAKT